MDSEKQGEHGFALGLVVLLLFAVGTLGAAGYQIVRTEAAQARYSAESTRALAVAQGGLQWFAGRQGGVIPDTATYDINGGKALISARKLAALSPEEDLFFLTSKGTFVDPRRPREPAVRVLSQYAVLKNLPVKPLASLITTAGRVRIRQSAVVEGTDHAAPGQCAGSPGPSWAGVVVRSSVQTHGGILSGDPPSLNYGSFEKVVEAVGVPWDVLTDSSFPVEYDGTWPDFSSLASGEYPVVRVEGDLAPTVAQNGRGVLIVTGRLRIPVESHWAWRGIVMAEDLESVAADASFTVEGMLVAGQGAPMANLDLDAGAILFNSCYTAGAGAALAHLTALPGGWWEAF